MSFLVKQKPEKGPRDGPAPSHSTAVGDNFVARCSSPSVAGIGVHIVAFPKASPRLRGAPVVQSPGKDSLAGGQADRLYMIV
jgi:hypothetical protein